MGKHRDIEILCISYVQYRNHIYNIYIYIYDYIMYVELYGCDWLCLKMGGQ